METIRQTGPILDYVYPLLETAVIKYPLVVLGMMNRAVNEYSARGEFGRWVEHQERNGMEPIVPDARIYKEPNQLQLAGLELLRDAPVAALEGFLNPYILGLIVADWMEMAKMPKVGQLFDQGVESVESTIEQATKRFHLPIPRLQINETLISLADYVTSLVIAKNLADGDIGEAVYKIAALTDRGKKTGIYVAGIKGIYAKEAIRNASGNWRPRIEVSGSHAIQSAATTDDTDNPLAALVKSLFDKASDPSYRPSNEAFDRFYNSLDNPDLPIER